VPVVLTLEPFAPEDVMPKFVVVVPDSAEDELVVVYEGNQYTYPLFW
jgi:hypothetical protein